MEEWKTEMDGMRDAIPELETKVEELMRTIELEKRRTKAYQTYKQADENDNVSFFGLFETDFY